MYGETVKPRTAEEKRWQAESDARTLAESDVIKSDKDRLKAATEAAKKMAKAMEKEAAATQKVATLSYKNTDKQEDKSGSGNG